LFNPSKKSIKDPYFDNKGPDRNGCILCGECMTGCKHNAKNTLDKNYLYLAEKNGVEIVPEREVVSVIPKNNEYIVKSKKSTGIYSKREDFKAKKIIFSGGVMGTVKLLFKCKSKGYLKNISDQLGNYVRTNSESILGIRSRKLAKEKDLTKGVAISAGFKPDDTTHIETCRYGAGQNSMSLLTTHLIARKGAIVSILSWFFRIISNPVKFIKDTIPYKWSSQTVILLVMQPINNYLKLSYDSRWWRLGFKSMNSNLSDGTPIPSSIESGEKVANMIADKIDGVVTTTYMDSFLSIPTTAHILGGACMGSSIEDGVIDESFEVYNYPGLYVIDGSAVPSNLGVNPSLTITAMAEYAISKFSNKN